jgi:glycosyltransferase involved in cell wall biosynthesis
MRISHATRIKNINPANGYGYATDRMVASLTRQGHEVVQNDPTAPVQIWFDQPHHWRWNDSDQYRIGYHPWESTRLKDGWVDMLNQCDEVWAPSPLVAKWYREDGVKVPVHVYLHGVDPVWTPTPRKPKGKIRFLHVGLEAARKGGMETMRGFRKAFLNRDDVELTLKMINPGWNVPTIGKANIINRTLGLEQLVRLFQEHDVFVYPSWGEGFGLTPLQALATGMPTITVPAWAPYAEHLDPRLSIRSRLVTSPWRELHPGKMFAPHQADLINHMRWVADNYDEAHAFAMSQTEAIVKEYDWDSLTRDMFDGLADRLEKR